MNEAERAATTMSQASAMLAPAPAATPLTAAIVGTGRLAQREYQGLVVALDRLTEVRPGAARRHLPVAEVLARAESAARARQDENTRTIPRQPIERVAQLDVHFAVEAVESLGAIQGESRDGAADRVLNRLVVHRGVPVIRRS